MKLLCWLGIHSWGRWSEPFEGIQRIVLNEVVVRERETLLQERYCSQCNKRVVQVAS